MAKISTFPNTFSLQLLLFIEDYSRNSRPAHSPLSDCYSNSHALLDSGKKKWIVHSQQKQHTQRTLWWQSLKRWFETTQKDIFRSSMCSMSQQTAVILYFSNISTFGENSVCTKQNKTIDFTFQILSPQKTSVLQYLKYHAVFPGWPQIHSDEKSPITSAAYLSNGSFIKKQSRERKTTVLNVMTPVTETISLYQLGGGGRVCLL